MITSNRTPKVNAVVIALARKHKILLGLLAVLIFAGGIVYQRHYDKTHFTLSGHSFIKEVVNTEKTRAKGLSGRENLAGNAAMIFVFDAPDMRCFWMKEMKFPIDMVWVNAGKVVVAVEANVTPATFPTNFCHADAQYVVELKAGTAKDLGIKPGDVLGL